MTLRDLQWQAWMVDMYSRREGQEWVMMHPDGGDDVRVHIMNIAMLGVGHKVPVAGRDGFLVTTFFGPYIIL